MYTNHFQNPRQSPPPPKMTALGHRNMLGRTSPSSACLMLSGQGGGFYTGTPDSPKLCCYLSNVCECVGNPLFISKIFFTKLPRYLPFCAASFLSVFYNISVSLLIHFLALVLEVIEQVENYDHIYDQTKVTSNLALL